MDFDFLRSATASSSAYRVVCGEMIIDSNMWNVHNEVLVAVVRDGYIVQCSNIVYNSAKT